MVETNNFVQPAGKIVYQGLQIAVGHDRFGNRQERLVLLTRGLRRFFRRNIVHVEDPFRPFAF
ncbi:MAG TPA: hypothetical protein VMG10_10440 [Gemmataceae bacterium]|nr:hypothetical protein [Gemmataceae bacterium]